MRLKNAALFLSYLLNTLCYTHADGRLPVGKPTDRASHPALSLPHAAPVRQPNYRSDHSVYLIVFRFIRHAATPVQTATTPATGAIDVFEHVPWALERCKGSAVASSAYIDSVALPARAEVDDEEGADAMDRRDAGRQSGGWAVAKPRLAAAPLVARAVRSRLRADIGGSKSSRREVGERWRWLRFVCVKPVRA